MQDKKQEAKVCSEIQLFAVVVGVEVYSGRVVVVDACGIFVVVVKYVDDVTLVVVVAVIIVVVQILTFVVNIVLLKMIVFTYDHQTLTVY